ncbi:MAG: TolC family protein [Saprospiraceae bacterium]
MYKKISLPILLAFFFIGTVNSQEVWSLEKCIQKAINNSLSMEQADVGLKNAKLSSQESKNARLPTINGSLNGDVNFGRTIDPVTNSFSNEALVSNSMGIFGSVTLYNGGRINNTIRQNGFSEDAARADKKNIENILALQVAEAYINVLFADEQLANATKQLEQTKDQLAQTDKLIQAGTLPRADRLDILATIATNEQVIVTQQNNLDLNYLSLKQLMTLEPDFDLTIEKPTVIISKSLDPDAYVLRNVYNKAYNNQPIISAGKLRLKSAELGIDIARSLRIPTVSLSGNINTFWSDQTKQFTFDGLRFGNPQSVIIGGSGTTIAFEEPTFVQSKRAYFDQLSDHFGQGVGLDINIPIYNANRTSIAIQRAELNIISQQITNTQNEQQLKTDIQRAIAASKAGKKQYEASQKTVDALREAYSNTEKRYELGAINTFEYTTAKNQLDQAEVSLIIDKYNYLYTLKVVDFYLGNKITLR